MKQTLKICAALAVIFIAAIPVPVSAQQNCYADYKAKRSASGSLQLHYGVIQLQGGSCQNANAASNAVAKRIGRDGWRLLRVMSTFDQSGLNQRKQNAGQYFLKY